MYRSHNCGELRINDLTKQVELSGWIQKIRDKGFIMWVDLRDRYGITQLILVIQQKNGPTLVELFYGWSKEIQISLERELFSHTVIPPTVESRS